jgi:hypothetical protein
VSDNSFQVYRNGAMTLAQTLIVKSEYVAQRTNDRLLQFLEHETDLERPETWKYYMNLAGEYHPTDTVMRVTSSDNLEDIEFTKANMIRHRNTLRDYQFGTRQYGELLEKYPGQEDVILGILYPVDKAEAISAPDHKILGYPVNLIERNEYTLIEELQKWTQIYFKRYYNWQYTISDSLYYHVVLSMYHMNLFAAILTLRHKKHKTIEAHSYYVSQYLASNSNLGKYHKYMSLEQAMHFYRNIRYYQRHPGQNDTLDRLVDALMTKRFLPMASYSMRHDTIAQVDNIYPEVTFRRTNMTSIPSAGAPEYIDTNAFLLKEIPEAQGNDDEVAYAAPEIEQYLKDSPSNVVQTKLLESAMIDYSAAQTYKLEDIQVAHWLYYAHLGRYSAIINVSNPKTSERIVLTVKDAYTLALYCMFKSYGVEPRFIPLMGAQRVQRYPIPEDSDVKSIVDMEYISDFTWTAAKTFLFEVQDMISIDAFYDKTVQVHRLANHQRNLISYQEGMHHRGETFKMVNRYWEDAYIRLEPEDMTFSEWLFSRNLNFDDLDASEFELLYEAIVSSAIGRTLTTAPSLRNVQKAMVNALKDLSSYTIQVVAKMADEETIMTDFPSIRIGDQKVSAVGHEQMVVGDYDVVSQKVKGRNLENLPINIFSDVMSREGRAITRHYFDLKIGPYAPARGQVNKRKHQMSRIEVSVVNKPDVSGTNYPAVLGMNHFIALTDAQKFSLFE